MTFVILSSDSLQDLCEIERQCFGKDRSEERRVGKECL